MTKRHSELYFLIVYLEAACCVSTFPMISSFFWDENNYLIRVSLRGGKQNLKVFWVQGMCPMSQTVIGD